MNEQTVMSLLRQATELTDDELKVIAPTEADKQAMLETVSRLNSVNLFEDEAPEKLTQKLTRAQKEIVKQRLKGLQWDKRQKRKAMKNAEEFLAKAAENIKSGKLPPLEPEH